MKLSFKNRIIKAWFIIPLAAIAAILFYLNTSYERLTNGIESIKVVFDKPVELNTPAIYLTDSAAAEPNFLEHFLAVKANDSTFTISLQKKIKLRQFRLYFYGAINNATIKEIAIKSDETVCNLNLERFTKSKNVKIIDQQRARLSFAIFAGEDNTYFESPKFYYKTDYFVLLTATIVIVFFAFLFARLTSKINLLSFSSMTLAEFGVLAFIVSMFLPQRIFNITLIVSILLVIRDFNLRYFLGNKINLLFLAVYALILLNFLLVRPDYNFKAIEKYTLLLVLPVYVSCIRSNKAINLFCVAALVVGSALLIIAIIDISIFRNQLIVSFFNFTGAIHPVYFSYLLALSIVCVELNFHTKYKYIVHALLVILLILSSSKLVIFLTLVWFLTFVRKSIGIVIVSITLIALFIFAPTKERFESIVNHKDLSVISEKHIDNPDDPRLNGFTLRVVLWQESLKFSNVKVLIFGHGVSATGSRAYLENLTQRGLIHYLEYNAHNQYITMLYKLGILGLIALIAMLTYCIRQGIKTRNRPLLFFAILMCFAMLFESVLERVNGIALFGMVVLLLMNFAPHNKVKHVL